MEKITLFKFESPDINKSIHIYFNEEGQLFFDGYDVGKRVERYWGESDFEYDYIIESEEVNKLYPLFNLQVGNKSDLLLAIKNRFGVDEAYTLFGNFMEEHDIKFGRYEY